ncbi:hypothetical protein ACIA8E_33295 [Streptomyces sp. NPDC051664]|uniref:hypothetical protein n=1 Tax=Streptomyces sp. NPDC051664 TaxID=3365668 RepID=UPI003796AFBA
MAQLAMPNARFFTMPADDGTVNTYVLDSTNDSFSALSPDGDGWTVQQGGPVLLWDEAERSLAVRHTAGAPGPSEFIRQGDWERAGNRKRAVMKTALHLRRSIRSNCRDDRI